MTAAWNHTAGHRQWIRRRCAWRVALTFDSSSFEYDFDFNNIKENVDRRPGGASAGLTHSRAPKTPKGSGRALPYSLRSLGPAPQKDRAKTC